MAEGTKIQLVAQKFVDKTKKSAKVQTMQAEIQKGLLKVERHSEGYLAISVPNGWDDCKKLVDKILKFQGQHYAWTGWNSDRNEAFFRVTANFARIV